jgi:predicted negative regulator of RcsB-dependent stress response
MATTQVSQEKVQSALARVLLQKVQQDTHPSSTHLAMLEQTMPPSMYGDYLTMLLSKVAADRSPSVSMLARIQRFAERL